jgi:hypothetical protein
MHPGDPGAKLGSPKMISKSQFVFKSLHGRMSCTRDVSPILVHVQKFVLFSYARVCNMVPKYTFVHSYTCVHTHIHVFVHREYMTFAHYLNVFVFLRFIASTTSDALEVDHIWGAHIASPRCSIGASGAILESLRGWHWRRLMWNVVARQFGHDRPPLRWTCQNISRAVYGLQTQ